MSTKPINVVIKGDYTDRDIKRAIKDLQSLQKQTDETKKHAKSVRTEMGKEFSGIGESYKKAFVGLGAGIVGAMGAREVMAFFKDSMGAALEDEKALRSLAVTFQNVGVSIPVDEADKWLSTIAKSTGVAKSEMVPAFQKLITVTGDYEKAQGALSLAMDVTAGSPGKDLMTVTNALAKGYTGNTTALSRLGAGIDSTIIKSGDMVKITDALSQKFSGQAASAADSYQGKINRIAVAADLAKEKIGYSLLEAIDNFGQALGGPDGATTAIDQMGNGLSGLIDQLGDVVQGLSDARNAAEDRNTQDEYSQDLWRQFTMTIPFLGAGLTLLSKNQEDNARATAKANENMAGYYDAIRAYEPAATTAADTSDDLTTALEDTGTAARNAMSDVDKLRMSWDLLTGKKTTIEDALVAIGEDRRALENLNPKDTGKPRIQKAGTPAPSTQFKPTLNRRGGLALGSESGAKARDWVKKWVEDTMAGVSGYIADDNSKGAMRLWRRNRAFLTSTAEDWGIANPAAFARTYMPTPPVLKDIIADQRAARTTPSNYMNLPNAPATPQTNVVQNYYTFKFGDLLVKDAAEAARQAAEAARLKALAAAHGGTSASVGLPTPPSVGLDAWTRNPS